MVCDKKNEDYGFLLDILHVFTHYYNAICPKAESGKGVMLVWPM